jgi:hypothetical protein
MALWVSPLADFFGFSRRYVAGFGMVGLVALAVLLIADLRGRFFLWSLVGGIHAIPLCNFSMIARFVFALSVATELLAILVLIILAAGRHPLQLGAMKRSAGTVETNRLIRRVGTAIAFVSMLLFLHLFLYGMAFHADDVCSTKSSAEIVRHYVALVAATIFYSLGSVFLIGCAMLVLKPSVLAK